MATNVIVICTSSKSRNDPNGDKFAYSTLGKESFISVRRMTALEREYSHVVVNYPKLCIRTRAPNPKGLNHQVRRSHSHTMILILTMEMRQNTCSAFVNA